MLLKIVTVILVLNIKYIFSNVRPRIVGGQNAYLGQFKHQVYLTGNTGYFCGGSIIAPNKILTAAHCVCMSKNNIIVVAGTTTLLSGGQRRTVKAIHCNKYTTQMPTHYDLAVLILEKNLTYSFTVNEIKIAKESPFDGESLIVSGWGMSSYPGNIPNNLQYATVKAMDTSSCGEVIPADAYINELHVCTIAPVGRGVCQGDSGSPLINSLGLQVGIVSWAIPCAKGKPDASTDVTKYFDWISSIQ